MIDESSTEPAEPTEPTEQLQPQFAPEPPGMQDSGDKDFVMKRHAPLRDALQQSSLFSNSELELSGSLSKIRKSVSAIHVANTSADHNQTLNTRRLMDACIVVVQMECRRLSAEERHRIINERFSPEFETRISQLMKIANIPGLGNHSRARADLEHLYNMDLRWNVFDEDKQVDFNMQAHFFSSIGWGEGNKQGYVRFSFDPRVLNLLMEPSQWATLSISAMRGLSSSAAYALYQICWKYINTEKKRTAVFPVETLIELLVGPSAYLKKSPSGETVVNYKSFKRRVLVDAISRINALEALSHTIRLQEFTRGRRIALLQFHFVQKTQVALGMPVVWGEEVVEPLKALGFAEAEITNWSELYSREVVAESLQKMAEASQKMKEKGRTITSKKAYFQGILENISKGATEAELNLEKIEIEAQKVESQRRNEERQKRNEQDFARHQVEKLRQALFDLPEAQRESLFREFEVSPEGIKAKMLWEKGWSETKQTPAYIILKSWLAQKKPELFEDLLRSPEDRTLEAWLAFRLEMLELGGTPNDSKT